MAILKKNIEQFPYTGFREVNGKLRLSTKSWLNCYFNGTPNCSQITGVTRGKIYDVVGIEGFGDCEEVFFINDNGEIQELCDFFFEEVT